MLTAVCSNRPRPTVQRNGKGSQWWTRDVYHIQGEAKRTLCGRDASEWLTIGPIAGTDNDCCARCARKAST